MCLFSFAIDFLMNQKIKILNMGRFIYLCVCVLFDVPQF